MGVFGGIGIRMMFAVDCSPLSGIDPGGYPQEHLEGAAKRGMKLHSLMGQIAVQVHGGGQVGQLGEGDSYYDRDHKLH